MKNARCGHTMEKKKREAKPKVDIICVYGRYDRGGTAILQHNKHGITEEENKRL